MPLSASSIVLFLLSFLQIIYAQTVAPFPTHDCSNDLVYTGSLACHNVLTECCGAPGVSCAGGCCPFDALCVFEGTADEACCPISDSTSCRAAAPVSFITSYPYHLLLFLEVSCCSENTKYILTRYSSRPHPRNPAPSTSPPISPAQVLLQLVLRCWLYLCRRYRWGLQLSR